MERIDPAKAAAVWQRVHSNPPAMESEQVLPAMIREELANSALYIHLARKLGMPHSQVLQQIARQELAHSACLKGICRMRTGAVPAVERPSLSQDAPEALLRRCYEQKLRAVNQYGSRSSDPQFGPVFAHLARQEQEHCRLLLEILGSLK